MRKLFYYILGVSLMFFTTNVNAQTYFEGKKVLIAYYSYSGNTKEVAEAIQKVIGGDIFEIATNHKYPNKYKPMTEQAKVEIEQGFRPELSSKVNNLEQYDVVFIGSPNWWGTITPAISSFLENYDFEGKVVVPFITHGGGGEQRTLNDFIEQCKDCVVKKGWVGSSRQTEELEKWLRNIK